MLLMMGLIAVTVLLVLTLVGGVVKLFQRDLALEEGAVLIAFFFVVMILLEIIFTGSFTR